MAKRDLLLGQSTPKQNAVFGIADFYCLGSVCLTMLMVGLSACGVLQPKQEPSQTELIVKQQAELTPAEQQGVMREVAESWLYGPGLGASVLNVGAIVLFPPYGLYVLGNAVLDLSGYEPLYVTNLLPDPERQDYKTVYDSVTGAPGRFAAAVAGKEYRSAEVARARIKERLAGAKNSSSQAECCT